MVADKQHAWQQVHKYVWYIDDILKMNLAVPESSYTKDSGRISKFPSQIDQNKIQF